MFVQLCKCLSDSMMLKAWESKHFKSWIASNPTRHWKSTWHLSVDYTLSSLSVWPSVRSLHSFNSLKMTESIANKLSTKQFRRRTFKFIHLNSYRFPLQKGHTSINEGWKQDRIFNIFIKRIIKPPMRIKTSFIPYLIYIWWI